LSAQLAGESLQSPPGFAQATTMHAVIVMVTGTMRENEGTRMAAAS